MAAITGNLYKLRPIITGNYGSVITALNPNWVLFTTVKEFWKSFNIWQSCSQRNADVWLLSKLPASVNYGNLRENYA